MALASRFWKALIASVLAVLTTAPHAMAVCNGVGDLSSFFGDETRQCYIDGSTGTDLEMALGVQGDCSDFTLIASAVYTGTNGVVTTKASYNNGRPPAGVADDDSAFLYFGFDVPYSAIMDGSPITWIRSYAQGPATASLGSGVSTLHITPTLKYVVATDTIIATAETTTSMYPNPSLESVTLFGGPLSLTAFS